MKLVENWKAVLNKAWSVKLSWIASAFVGIQQGIDYIPAGLFGASPELMTSIGAVFGAIGLVFTAAVSVARIIDQGIGSGES